MADYPAYCALWADPVVTHFIGAKPSTAEDTWARLLRHAGHWSLLGFGSWLVEEKATGAMAGEVGFFDYRRNITPALTTPEIGWIFAPAMHGRGYATEAVSALIAWAQHRFSATELTCIVHPENLASLRVAEKHGFIKRSRKTYRDAPAIVLTRAL